MKLLTKPFGWPQGVGISLRHEAADPLDEETLYYVLVGHSCYPPAVPKIISCLLASRRYDCRVMDGVARNKNLRRALAGLGIRLIVEDIAAARQREMDILFGVTPRKGRSEIPRADQPATHE